MAKRPRYSERELLAHIVELCDTIAQTLGEKSFEEFKADRNLADATAYRLQAIGESCRKLSDDLKARYDLPWTDIIGMRHILSHDYLAISKAVVWETAISDLGELHETCRSALGNIGPPERS